MGIVDKATRLTARVAPYLSAIAAARAAGLTWGDIATALGASSPGAVRQAFRNCKYKANQLPLPEQEWEPKPVAQTQASRAQEHQESQPKQSTIKRLSL